MTILICASVKKICRISFGRFLKSILKSETISDEKCFLFYIFVLILGHVGKSLNKKAKLNFKIYDVAGWAANNYTAHIL